jgi:23S rRNA (cytosine1962-C5)-methyltransferase
MPRALTLPRALADRVRRGASQLNLDGFPAGGPTDEPGRPLFLVDDRGEVLATALADPENGLLRVLEHDEVKLDSDFYRGRIDDALRLRRGLGLVDGQQAYRLLNAAGDGLSGFVADVYGDYVVLYAYSRGLLGAGKALAKAIIERLGTRGVVLKVRPKGGPRPGKIRQEVLGDEPPKALVVQEHGVPFEVHLLGGLNVGLFTDLREQRRALGRFVHGRRILNTFSYTGALSVAAARAGATSVTSVDLSSGVQKWAQTNFQLSGLDPESDAFRFETNDVTRFLKAELAAEASYDTIILDPPTYSAARASAWSMKNDYPDLIAAAARLLPADGGFLWVSANTHRGGRGVADYVRAAMDLVGRNARVLEVAGLPADYPTRAADPGSRYLEVHWLWVDGR